MRMRSYILRCMATNAFKKIAKQAIIAFLTLTLSYLVGLFMMVLYFYSLGLEGSDIMKYENGKMVKDVFIIKDFLFNYHTLP